MANFMNAMKQTLDDTMNVSVTENGAIGYRTSGKELLDLNFAVSSLRSATPTEIANRFTKAFFEDKVVAMKWLFYARDIRGGLGERRLFRTVLCNMAQNNPEYVKPLIEMVPEYGRWDDLWCLLDTSVQKAVLILVSDQLKKDIVGMEKGEGISLLAKWLPSVKSNNQQTRKYARQIYSFIGVDERTYRKTRSKLIQYLDVVEVKMSSGQWNEIKYEAVPSRANLRYNSAFLRHDEERRREFLSKLEKGETKINAGTLFPHDIVYQYGGSWYTDVKPYDATLEGLWKALPDTVQGCGNTIVVADGSGSMTSPVSGGSNVSALSVANALSIYFAERSSGEFKDKYITFSSRPKLVDLSKGKNLREKLQIARRHDEVANTNIEAVFELILRTAIENNMTQEDIPHNVLIISDMEFDACVESNRGRYSAGRSTVSEALFTNIAQKYEANGYKLPRLVFWNVCSRTGTIPVKQNELGVALVSGFSTNIAKMVMSNQTDPYQCLLEVLNAERYAPIECAITDVIGQ